MHQAHHRSENLRADELAIQGNILQYCGLYEIPVFITWNGGIAPIQQQRGSFGHPLFNQSLNSLLALRSNHRTHLNPFIQSKPGGLIFCGLHQRIPNVSILVSNSNNI